MYFVSGKRVGRKVSLFECTDFQLRTTSPLYKQNTDTVEHKYTKATVFINN
jgi:hypothetical protein